ncbi:MAG: hypothetical protein E8A46_18505 [Bradyrhizobium sp.]|nr:MAG: hypothetical protein E8A46_18505 [Bradyrhizobium sp.]
MSIPPSPRSRGRDERSSLLEGRGEGDSPRITLAESPPHPALRADLSPQAGRGQPNALAYSVQNHHPLFPVRTGAKASRLARQAR